MIAPTVTNHPAQPISRTTQSRTDVLLAQLAIVRLAQNAKVPIIQSHRVQKTAQLTIYSPMLQEKTTGLNVQDVSATWKSPPGATT